MDTQNVDNYLATLGLLNTDSGIITNLCVPGDYVNPPAPVWSPDGKFLAVYENHLETDETHSLIIDLATGTAIDLGFQYEPVGWLK